MIKAIFFDLDDTLYDQLQPFELAIKAVGLYPLLEEKIGIEHLYKRIRRHSDQLWSHYVDGRMTLETLRVKRTTAAFSDIGLAVSDEAAQRLQEQYELEQTRLQLRAGIPELLEQLQLRGIQVGLITNGPVEHQMSKIIALDLLRWIEEPFIFISDGIGAAKPNVKVFEWVQQQTKFLPEQFIYVGDAWHNDIAPSFRAGWMPIWLNGRLQKPNLDDGSVNYLECRSITELTQLLIQQCETDTGCLL